MEDKLKEDHVLKIIKKVPFYEKGFYPDLAGWDDLERLLNLRPFVDDAKFQMIDPKSYGWRAGRWLSNFNTFPVSTLKEVLANHTCYFSDASRVSEKVNNFAEEIERKLFAAADAHLYFCLSNNLKSGFGSHYDYADNLIIQAEGKSRYRIWDKIAKPGDDRILENDPEGEPLIDITMEPGDIVYAPALFIHRIDSLSKRFSVSFPFQLNCYEDAQERSWLKIKDIL